MIIVDDMLLLSCFEILGSINIVSFFFLLLESITF